MIADDLTREAYANSSLGQENLSFRDRHPRRFSFNEFHATRRAAGIAAAGVQLIDVCVLLEREHEALAVLNIKRSKSFHRQLGHV